MRTSNSVKYPEAWKIYIDCVRKWESDDLKKYPTGWKYGIPNPAEPASYIYSHCPGMLFIKFKDIFYKNSKIAEFRKFLWWLDSKEGRMTSETYQSNVRFLENY